MALPPLFKLIAPLPCPVNAATLLPPAPVVVSVASAAVPPPVISSVNPVTPSPTVRADVDVCDIADEPLDDAVNDIVPAEVKGSLNAIVEPLNVNALTDVALEDDVVVIAPALVTLTVCDEPPNVFNSIPLPPLFRLIL